MELFKLFGTIAVNNDEANNAINQTTENAEKSGGKLSAAFGKFTDSALKIGKAVAVGIGAAASAIGVVGKASIEAYGSYEQLVGGVETLFKNSSDAVLKYAQNAYKTAGMSANEYMETVTSFSASLLQSLGGDTAAAAEKADMAITDMSDNANKMGSDIASIQNAYQGFAKQNYTMLDNLKLGYGGTKEEMERLLEDAQAISGIEYDVSSYADVVDAIHVIQTEMGVTGTTAKEASTTIQGSISSMKASWENLLVGLSDDTQDLDSLIEQFVQNVITVIDNILPRITIIAKQVPNLVESLVAQLPGIIESILPSLISAAIKLVSGLVSALPQIISALIAVLPMLLEGLTEITNELVAALPQIIDAIISFLTDPSAIQLLLTAAITLFMAIPRAIAESLPEIIAAAPDIINGIIEGLINAVPALLSSFGEILSNLLDAFLEFFGIHSPSTLMKEKSTSIVDGIIEGIRDLPEKAAEWFEKMKNKIVEICDNIGIKIANIFNGIKTFFINVWNEIKTAVETVLTAIQTVVTTVFDAVKLFIETVLNAIKTTVTNIWNGIKSSITTVINAIRTTVSNVFNGIKNTVSNIFNSVKSTVTSVWNAIKTAIETPINKARDTVKKAIDKIKSFFDNLTLKFPDIKLPHFSIEGKFSLNPISVPHLSIDWYKKAMDNAMLLNSPTIFGMNPAGQLMGGGEAGQEVVAGSGTLLNMIRAAVKEENSGLTYQFERLISMLANYFPEILANMGNDIVLNDGVLVGRLAPQLDSKLGDISELRKRGR